jgi:hypothetical protein
MAYGLHMPGHSWAMVCWPWSYPHAGVYLMIYRWPSVGGNAANIFVHSRATQSASETRDVRTVCTLFPRLPASCTSHRLYIQTCAKREVAKTGCKRFFICNHHHGFFATSKQYFLLYISVYYNLFGSQVVWRKQQGLLSGGQTVPVTHLKRFSLKRFSFKDI